MDTKFTYNSTPYNFQDQDKHPINRGALKPSYRYKNSKVIWLHSGYTSRSITNGTTHFQHSWDIPSFQLYNRTRLSVISYTTNESSAKPIIMRIESLNFDADSTYSSDKDGSPIIFVAHTGVASQLNNNQISLILLPQVISTITIDLNNSFTSRDKGFTISSGENGNGNYILGLLFEDDDLIMDDASSIYK